MSYQISLIPAVR